MDLRRFPRGFAISKRIQLCSLFRNTALLLDFALF
ncbi:hypothetical protein ANCCAN_30453 [Ancylostoma caninum]|uniref:Uncharacterized protein n=1 Tax=Ancylostoma caninum TaxID=29170 RepID=A0A368EX36_ANCCA|nr:hypothetical protein ANCCAN_30453 [Ancylostoma caninum]